MKHDLPRSPYASAIVGHFGVSDERFLAVLPGPRRPFEDTPKYLKILCHFRVHVENFGTMKAGGVDGKRCLSPLARGGNGHGKDWIGLECEYLRAWWAIALARAMKRSWVGRGVQAHIQRSLLCQRPSWSPSTSRVAYGLHARN